MTQELYIKDGFSVGRGIVPQSLITEARESLLAVVEVLSPGAFARAEGDLDRAWFELISEQGRLSGGLLYNAAKHLPALRKIAVSDSVFKFCSELIGSDKIALVDINFRIDPPAENQYLFSWHQDFWFSMCSPKALVAWIPITNVDNETGGVDLISLVDSQSRIFRVRKADDYRSYSDSLVLDEAIDYHATASPDMAAGDLLCFRFDVLHRSRPNVASGRCRWTLQLRWAAYDDPAFIDERFQPGIVTKNMISYLERQKS